MNIYSVTLNKDEREALCELTSKGKHNSQQILNALILLNCEKSEWDVNCSTNEESSCVFRNGEKIISKISVPIIESFPNENLKLYFNHSLIFT